LPGNDSAGLDAIPSEHDRGGRAEVEETVDQRDLVERAKRGDHDAFAVLVGATIARVDAAARLILRDPELARDAVQEGYLRAWRSLAALRDPDRFEAWLHRLVIHSCIDVTRRRRRRPLEVELTPIDGPATADVASTVADREQLDMALRRLDPEWRAVVVLYYYLGMPLPAVAATLGIPLGTAKSRLHRSLAAMRVTIGMDEAVPAAVPGGQFA
jgi:RNA polymerase sigma-70 factor (ECF subfamily)